MIVAIHSIIIVCSIIVVGKCFIDISVLYYQATTAVLVG